VAVAVGGTSVGVAVGVSVGGSGVSVGKGVEVGGGKVADGSSAVTVGEFSSGVVAEHPTSKHARQNQTSHRERVRNRLIIETFCNPRFPTLLSSHY
jgi:hypothetical protein